MAREFFVLSTRSVMQFRQFMCGLCAWLCAHHWATLFGHEPVFVTIRNGGHCQLEFACCEPFVLNNLGNADGHKVGLDLFMCRLCAGHVRGYVRVMCVVFCGRVQFQEFFCFVRRLQFSSCGLTDEASQNGEDREKEIKDFKVLA